MVLCLLLCFCNYVSVFNMFLFQVCKYVAFLLRQAKCLCLSPWIKLTDHDTFYRYLPKQKLPGFMEGHYQNLTVMARRHVIVFLRSVTEQWNVYDWRNTMRQVFLRILRVSSCSHWTCSLHFTFTPRGVLHAVWDHPSCLNLQYFRSDTVRTACMLSWVRINLLKPTGDVMHQQFNIQQLYDRYTLLCNFLW